MRSLTRGLEVVSPRHRRWRRTLASLTLDPDQLAQPLSEPGSRDFLICGCPRTGTALLTAMLFQPPKVVTVMEPWDAMRLPPAELFRSVREEIASSGVLGRGRLDIDALRSDGEVQWCADGGRPVSVETTASTLVGIKFPAFWRYLDLLPTTRFLICVRDPGETLQSFCHTGGRLQQGLDYDIPFNRAMNERLLKEHSADETRRVGLYDLINEAALAHRDRPEVHLVRYERWFEDPAAQMAEIAAFLGTDLEPGLASIRPRDARGASRSTRSRTAGRLGYPS